MNGLVSVVIPVYNGARYLGEAIDSALAQTYRNFEIIVINDGPTDGSEEVAKGYGDKIRYTVRENGGISAARNTGIAMAKGNYFALLDSDDIWEKNKLKLQIQAFESDSSLDVVYGLVKQFVSPEIEQKNTKNADKIGVLMQGCITSAIIIKRASFFRVGSFETAYKVAEFVDWFIRAKDMGLRFNMVNELVALRRIHDANQGTIQVEHSRTRHLGRELNR